ncbi:MAG: hypothetical protein ACREGE_00915 [Candidatus Microsaccharimonas sp.]
MNMEVEEDSRPVVANVQSPYEEALQLFQHGIHLYTGKGEPVLDGWRYDNHLWCFHRAVIALTSHAKDDDERQLLANAQYYLYKSFYRTASRQDAGRSPLARKLRILHVECELAKSTRRRHRLATWIVEHFAPLEPVGIRLLDVYDRFRPAY